MHDEVVWASAVVFEAAYSLTCPVSLGVSFILGDDTLIRSTDNQGGWQGERDSGTHYVNSE
jgi:hypothetical protein